LLSYDIPNTRMSLAALRVAALVPSPVTLAFTSFPAVNAASISADLVRSLAVPAPNVMLVTTVAAVTSYRSAEPAAVKAEAS